jgi:tetratricopeptide (TPR) repeat protein
MENTAKTHSSLPRLRNCLLAALVISVCVLQADGQATQKLRGFIERRDNHQGVPLTVMGIKGGSAGEVDKDGNFSVPVSVTMPEKCFFDFYVKGWIVDSPRNEGTPGRMIFIGVDYKYILTVVRPRDPSLVSDAGIHNLLLSAVDDFQRLEAADIGERRYGQHPSIVPVSLGDDARSRTEIFFRKWLAHESEELGFSIAELEQAVDLWLEKPKSPLDQGLAALYQGRFDSAIDWFLKSQADPEERRSALKATAFAYGLQREWTAAAQYLQQAIAEDQERDPGLYRNLAAVFKFAGKPAEATRALEHAKRLWEMQCGSLCRSTGSTTSPPSPTGQNTPPPLPQYCSPGFSQPNTYTLEPEAAKKRIGTHYSHLQVTSVNAVRLVRATTVVCADGKTVFQQGGKFDSGKPSERHTINLDLAGSDIRKKLKRNTVLKMIIETDRPIPEQPTMDFKK